MYVSLAWPGMAWHGMRVMHDNIFSLVMCMNDYIITI